MKQDHPEYFDDSQSRSGLFSATPLAKISSEIADVLVIIRQNKMQEIVTKDLEAICNEDDYEEGGRRERFSSYYERNSSLRAAAISIHGTTGMVPGCGFNFKTAYGEHGKDFIEVHHLIPVSKFSEKTNVNPKSDMVVVYSNCHRMIHRQKDKIFSLEQVGKLIASAKSA